MRFVKIVLFLISISFFYACEEKNDVIFVPDANLVWTGDYDVDGCGFFVETNGNVYKPENEGIIPPEYRVGDSLSISVQFIDLLYDIEYFCGDLPNANKAGAITLTSVDLNQDLP